MKDERVRFFRKTLEGLIESLHATVRVNRWAGPDAIPEPLRDSAARLLELLGAADRLASSTFTGSTADIARVNAMCASMRRLDAAYVDYRKQFEMAPAERELASTNLDAEIDEVKSEASRWA